MPKTGPGSTPNRDPMAQVFDVESSIVASSGAVLSNELVSCAGCGGVFSVRKLAQKNPSVKVIPNDLSNITCPICLTTCGWENV